MTQTEVAAPPAARRQTRPRWLDVRIIGGALLLIGSIVVGTKVVASASKTMPMLAATHDLAAGTIVTDDDFTVVDVNLGAAASSYLPAQTSLAGQILHRDIAAGELVPADIIAAVSDGRIVLVPVGPERLVPGVTHGSVIDLYVVRGRAAVSSDPVHTELLFAGAVVQSVSDAASGGLSAAISAKHHLALHFSPEDAATVVAELSDGEALVVLHSAG